MDRILISEISKIKQMMGVQILTEGVLSSILNAILHTIKAEDQQLIKNFLGHIITAEDRESLKLFMKSNDGKNFLSNLKNKTLDRSIVKSERTLAKKELEMLKALENEVINLPYGPIGGGTKKTVGKQTTKEVLSNLRQYYPEFTIYETKIENLFPQVSQEIKNDILLSFRENMHKTNKELLSEIKSLENAGLLNSLGIVGKIIKGAYENRKIIQGSVTSIMVLAIIYIALSSGIRITSSKTKQLEKELGVSQDIDDATEKEFKEWVIRAYPLTKVVDQLQITINGKIVSAKYNNKTLTYEKISDGKFNQIGG